MKTSHWFDRTFKPVGTVSPPRQLARDQAVREEARDLKKRIRDIAIRSDALYEMTKGVVRDLDMDGHDAAHVAAKVALLRLKQAEAELERARALIVEPRPSPDRNSRMPW